MAQTAVQFPSGSVYDTATIASGASLSGVLNLQGKTLTKIIMPGTWTAATLTFAFSTTEGGTYVPMVDDDGTEYEVAASASIGIAVDPAAFAGIDFLKIRSGTSSLAVNQGGDRILTVIAAELND